MTRSRMIAVRVRDHRAVDGTPGVDEEIARRAVESLRADDDEVHCAHHRIGRDAAHGRCDQRERRSVAATGLWSDEVTGIADDTTLSSARV